MNNAMEDIKAEMRLLDSKSLRDLKGIAKRWNITPESFVWIFISVYSNGHMRSHAFADVPKCVIDDGLACERDGGELAYTPWSFTPKALDIIAARG